MRMADSNCPTDKMHDDICGYQNGGLPPKMGIAIATAIAK